MANEPVVCLFCQVPGETTTVEHLLSKPIRECLPGSGQGEGRRYQSPRGGVPRVRTATFPMKTASFTPRAFCEKCNSGWMQEMDNEIASLVCPMIQGQRVALSRSDQQRLAAWAAKIALVGHALAGKERAVPDTEYFRFFAERRPLAGYYVLLAHFTGKEPVPLSVGMRTIIREGEDHVVTSSQSVLVTLRLGALIIQAMLVGHSPIRDPLIPPFPEMVFPIWPILGPVEWPPRIGIDDLAFRAMSGEFME